MFLQLENPERKEEKENNEEESNVEQNDELQEKENLINENLTSEDLIEKLESEEVNKSENLEFNDGNDESNIELASKPFHSPEDRKTLSTRYILQNLIIQCMQIKFVMLVK